MTWCVGVPLARVATQSVDIENISVPRDVLEAMLTAAEGSKLALEHAAELCVKAASTFQESMHAACCSHTDILCLVLQPGLWEKCGGRIHCCSRSSHRQAHSAARRFEVTCCIALIAVQITVPMFDLSPPMVYCLPLEQSISAIGVAGRTFGHVWRLAASRIVVVGIGAILVVGEES